MSRRGAQQIANTIMAGLWLATALFVLAFIIHGSGAALLGALMWGHLAGSVEIRIITETDIEEVAWLR